jgi:hypothetical protein
MRKIATIAILATLALVITTKPADACSCSGDACSFLDPIAYALGIGIVGGYAYGTGTFIYRDVTDDTQSLEYGATEAGVNLALGSMFATGAVDSFQHGKIGSGLVLSGFTAVHGTLAAHGTWRMYTQRGEFKPPPDRTLYGVAAIAYATNTIAWTANMGGEHGRGYGIAEAAVNAPIVAGLGYLAVDRARDGDLGPAVLYGGMAALSSVFVVHGVKTAFSPTEVPDLDLLGTDVAPTMVSDGRSSGFGLGAAGTW